MPPPPHQFDIQPLFGLIQTEHEDEGPDFTSAWRTFAERIFIKKAGCLEGFTQAVGRHEEFGGSLRRTVGDVVDRSAPGGIRGEAVCVPGLVKSLSIQLLGELGLPALADECVDLPAMDGQVIVCKGARPHHDGHHWPDFVFLSQYVDGPPMDLLIPLAGLRMTLEQGDVFFFDPTMPHALVPAGVAWGGELPDNTPVSSILSIEVPLSEAVREAFGIRLVTDRQEAALYEGSVLFSPGHLVVRVDRDSGGFHGVDVRPVEEDAGPEVLAGPRLG